MAPPKAQKAFHALSEEDKKQYDKVVQIILCHFQLTPEARAVLSGGVLV